MYGWTADGTYENFERSTNANYGGDYGLYQEYSSSWSWYNSYVYSPELLVNDVNVSIGFHYNAV